LLSSARAAIGWALILMAAAACLPSLAAAEPGTPVLPEEQGPFEERNQFPFNLLFLEFPARGGRILARGEQELLISQTYSNTFVGSNDFFQRFDPFSDDRQRLTKPILDYAQSLRPGQSLFFVDTEQARTELRWRAGIARRFEAGLELPFLSYRGGCFDSLIEAYHRTLGLSSEGRDLYVQNLSQFAITLGGDSYFSDGTPDLYQMGDLALFGRFQMHSSSSRDLALTAAFKLPTGEPSRLGGSGATDYGLEMEGTERWGRHRLHYGAGWVRTGGWSLFPRFRPADTANLTAAYEFAHRRGLSWIAQLQTQSSVFRGGEGADPDLSQPSTEFVGGIKGSIGSGGWSYEGAFIENLFNQNNGVDIGFRAGVAYRIGP
jgi:uncharacterized protein DUF3187